MHAILTDVDFIEEIRLRRWARENYKPAGERDESWHPVVLDEMQAKDTESHGADLVLHNDAT
ncbi:MAG: hypothetical protein HY290_18825 [Planctomycetia bacterium]|nr:hypothetical protein [Planctomycetia bacterium]